MSANKYRPFPPVDLPDRQWPAKVIEKAPMWCSVDLRDGNQALIEPMGSERKMKMFETLVAMGFKEIEVGFPAASQTDYDFLRTLIDGGHIPADVTIQVLTQSREPLIRRTFEAIAGAPRSIVHLYNSTSELQRRVVFRQDRQGIVDIAKEGARLIKELADAAQDEVVFQYSPESFTGTELDFAVEICEAVMDVFAPTVEKPLIVNLPATVEMASPNVYADQIEWFARRIKNRETLILSLHPHNDRGTAVAATELGLMAGADRVEGTLFGNGERTGNVDVVTLSLNMMTQGVEPGLDCSDIDGLVKMAETCTQLPVHPRHPYAGELVYTAFSGSHQDAIKKGMAAMETSNSEVWEVPYLPIDPADVGRNYEAVIRINSQSGKGGVAFVLEREHGIQMPRRLQMEFSQVVQKVADETGEEIKPGMIWRLFRDTYLEVPETAGAMGLIDYVTKPVSATSETRDLTATVRRDDRMVKVEGRGVGPIDAFVEALDKDLGIEVQVVDYHEHAVGTGADAMAVGYVEVKAADGSKRWGVGRHSNIVMASLKAVVSAVNRGIVD